MAAQRGQDVGKAFVHVRADSDSYLDALFDHLVNPTAQKVLPLRRRNIPDGFFSQQAASRSGASSSSGQHSRENSTDSSYAPSVTSQGGQTASHPRSQSLPASFSGATHRQQSSFEIQQSAGRTLQLPGHHRIVPDDDGYGPLPNGWAIAITTDGSKYFVDHVNKKTTWEDPRLAVRKDEEALPDGWQRAFTDEGLPYFINHRERTTTWSKPTSTTTQTVASNLQSPHSLHQNFQLSNQQNQHPRSQSLQRTQKLRIQRLQQEREMMRLQREREVLLRQHHFLLQKEMKLKQICDDLTTVQRDPMMSSVASVTGSGLTYHSRENSADYPMETVPTAAHTNNAFLSHPSAHTDSGLLDTFGEMGIGEGPVASDEGIMMVGMPNVSPGLASTAGTSALQYNTTNVHASGMPPDLLDTMEGTSVDDTPNIGLAASHAMDTDEDAQVDFLSEVRTLLSHAADNPLFVTDNFS